MNFGMSDEIYYQQSNDIDFIIHAAAYVNRVQPYPVKYFFYLNDKNSLYMSCFYVA